MSKALIDYLSLKSNHKDLFRPNEPAIKLLIEFSKAVANDTT